ncbi:MAG: AsnC family transcriptional regulator [Robiginitomaculum sp.]|nr:MAG: AsnC family transcriptional regulator [Robiginitomaculum sp.]
MDQIDRKIIRELQANGRLTNQDLAWRIGLSPSPCLRRVRVLEEEGFITGYTALVDQAKCGVPINVFVKVKMKESSEASMKKFEKGVQDSDEILECYLMTGNQDYLLHVVSASLGSYERFMRETLTRLPGVASIDSSFAYGRVKSRSIFPL